MGTFSVERVILKEKARFGWILALFIDDFLAVNEFANRCRQRVAHWHKPVEREAMANRSTKSGATKAITPGRKVVTRERGLRGSASPPVTCTAQ